MAVDAELATQRREGWESVTHDVCSMYATAIIKNFATIDDVPNVFT